MNAKERRHQLEVVNKLRDTLDELFPNSNQCGLCGDTDLGQRHRIIDSLAEQVRAGDDWERVIEPYPGYTVEHIIYALAVTAP